MASKQHISLGTEWVPIDASREGLFAFVLELEAGREPVVKTIAVNVPNILGVSDASQFYAIRQRSDIPAGMPAPQAQRPVQQPVRVQQGPHLLDAKTDGVSLDGLPERAAT